MAGSPWLLVPLLLVPELLGLVLLRRAGLALARSPLLAAGAAYGAGSFAIAALLLLQIAFAVPLTRSGVLLLVLGVVWLATLGPSPAPGAPAAAPGRAGRLGCIVLGASLAG